jgi:putative acetyltransferase
MITLRPERSSDEAPIRSLVNAAFGGTAHGQLVDLIRERGNARIAVCGEEDGRQVGYVVVSPMAFKPAISLDCLAIGPVAVVPDRQNSGVGSALMTRIIDLAKTEGIDALLLLGHPAYYPRFGFAPTHIDNQYGATDAFMALELKAGCLEGVQAKGLFVREFFEVDV